MMMMIESKPNVAVLGCGPAGLMAAHATRISGGNVAIFSRKQKSPLYGAQYLHAPIPGVTDPSDSVTVDYILRGHIQDYRRKVYGQSWDGTVSPDELESTHEAWDIRETYDRLWQMYQEKIIDTGIDGAAINQMKASKRFNLIINTIPLNMLCFRGHTFRYSTVVAAGDAPALGIDIGTLYHCEPDTVVCNGEEAPSWYRLSRIFGHTTVEWPDGTKPPVGTASQVIKPLEHNCDCFPDVMNVGRYGSWSKGVLSHTAYQKVYERMEGGKAEQEARYNDPAVPTLF